MAAATLIAARLFLDTYFVGNILKDAQMVKRFLRLSMGNDWSASQGVRGNNACPKIPSKVRYYYERIYSYQKDFLRQGLSHATKGRTIDASGIERWAEGKNVEHDISFERGGYADLFLLSILWAAGMGNSVTYFVRFARQVKLRESSAFAQYLLPDADVRELRALASHEKSEPNEDFESKIGVHLGKRKGALCIYSYHADVKTGPPVFDFDTVCSTITAFERSFRRNNAQILAVLLSIMDSRKIAHSIVLFPCKRSSAKDVSERYVLCNFWIDNADRAERETLLRKKLAKENKLPNESDVQEVYDRARASPCKNLKQGIDELSVFTNIRSCMFVLASEQGS